MKNFALKLTLIGLGILFVNNLSAQVAGEPISSTSNWSIYYYLDTNHPNISLTFSTPLVGEPVTTVSNSDTYIKISYYIGYFWRRWYPNGFGQITAAITSGSVPPGTTLTLVSAPCTTTNSAGDLGDPSPPITLTTSNQNIVTGIGTCYTGTGIDDGYQLTFTLKPTNYAQIVAGTYNVTVTLTLN